MQRIFNILFGGLLLFLFPLKGAAVTLSEHAEVSILTCGPGNMIHAVYGHTAIRFHDPAQNLDFIFNYGVFSFSKPNFVYRFAKGQTDYMLAVERFSDFYQGYREDQRSIDEQVLDLSLSGKQKLWDFLVENARPENREYRYNFFFDNCATRVRDVIISKTEGKISFPEQGSDMTFRQHINHYQKVLPWTDFGIDLALGRPTDAVATAFQEMFLPDFLMEHFGKARIETAGGTKPLVKEARTLYEPKQKSSSFGLITPLVVFTLLFIAVLLISVREYRRNIRNYLPDYLLLFLTGLIGVVVIFLMNWSEHPAVQANYNMVWAVPLNLPFLFVWMVKKWRSAVRWYWVALTVWLILFLLTGFLLPQSFHPAIYLIVLMMLCRSVLHTLHLYGERKASGFKGFYLVS
ncbi:MAG: DUF4105 domain-containing protein [Prolixibacteraceae bacterium]